MHHNTTPHHDHDFADGEHGKAFFRFMSDGFRAARGNLEPIILCVLNEKPMHGYEIIRTLEERHQGFWRPSPGSVYPILQLLEDKDMVSAKVVNGKKVYELTPQGVKATAGHKEFKSILPHHDQQQMKHRFHELKETVKQSIPIIKSIVLEGTNEEIDELKAILSETEKQLQALQDKRHSNQ